MRRIISKHVIVACLCLVRGAAAADLAAVPQLPKPHCTTYYRDMWNTEPSEELRQVCRITGTVPFGVGFDKPAFDRAAAVAREFRLPLAFNCHPWGYAIPAGQGPEVWNAAAAADFQRLATGVFSAAQWAAEAGIPVKYVELDSERWRMRGDPVKDTALLNKYELADRLVRAAFPQATSFVWYAAGQRVNGMYGWRADTYGAERIHRLDTYSTNLYELYNPELMSQKIIELRKAKLADGKIWIAPFVSPGYSWVPKWQDPIRWNSNGNFIPQRHLSGDIWMLGAGLNYGSSWVYPGSTDIPVIWIHPHPCDPGDKERPNRYGLRELCIYAYGARQMALPEELKRDPAGADLDGDGDVDGDDFAALQRCISGPGAPMTRPCP